MVSKKMQSHLKHLFRYVWFCNGSVTGTCYLCLHSGSNQVCHEIGSPGVRWTGKDIWNKNLGKQRKQNGQGGHRGNRQTQSTTRAGWKNPVQLSDDHWGRHLQQEIAVPVADELEGGVDLAEATASSSTEAERYWDGTGVWEKWGGDWWQLKDGWWHKWQGR